jgi:hypothetical protein
MPLTNYVPTLGHPAPLNTDTYGSGSPQGVVYGVAPQTYLDTDTNELWFKATTDWTNIGWLKVAGAAAGDQEIFVGAGSPEGVQAAVAGRAIYWDTTNKILYIKDAGTGTTGWREIVA